jgi:hypothetical protein
MKQFSLPKGLEDFSGRLKIFKSIYIVIQIQLSSHS